MAAVPASLPPANLSTACRCPLAAAAGSNQYTATIPASATDAGALVRWYVKATDTQGSTTRDPPFLTPDDRQYYGTIIGDAGDQAALPVLEL